MLEDSTPTPDRPLRRAEVKPDREGKTSTQTTSSFANGSPLPVLISPVRGLGLADQVVQRLVGQLVGPLLGAVDLGDRARVGPDRVGVRVLRVAVGDGTDDLAEPVEVGRQQLGDDGPFGGRRRVLVGLVLDLRGRVRDVLGDQRVVALGGDVVRVAGQASQDVGQPTQRLTPVQVVPDVVPAVPQVVLDGLAVVLDVDGEA
jgi:hypothetical protein